MAKQLTVTKIDRHSPQYGWVKFSDGVEGSYGSTLGNVWVVLPVKGDCEKEIVVRFGKRVELLKAALA